MVVFFFASWVLSTSRPASFCKISQAKRKLTPWVFITQSITDPATPQPKQWNRLVLGLMMNEGVSSPAWNGQRIAESWPCFLG